MKKSQLILFIGLSSFLLIIIAIMLMAVSLFNSAPVDMSRKWPKIPHRTEEEWGALEKEWEGRAEEWKKWSKEENVGKEEWGERAGQEMKRFLDDIFQKE